MDVKGAKALSERLAEAARNVDPPPAKAVGSGDTDRRPEVADTAAFGQPPCRSDAKLSATPSPCGA